MKTRKIFVLALVLLLVVALMMTVLVACNSDNDKDTTGETPSTGTGEPPDTGDDTGTGDVIFTADATLAGIIAALDEAESATYTYYYEYGGGEYSYRYNLTRDCVVAECVEKEGEQELVGTYYAVLKDGVFYDIACEQGVWHSDKQLASNTSADNLPSGLFVGYAYTVPYALNEVDGKLQPKDSMGVLSLDGDSVTLTSEIKKDGVTVGKEEHTLCLVNATEATVPADVIEIINTTDWADELRYNGVDYVKTMTTGASGEETTVYVYNDDYLPEGASPETTINGFPAIAESELAQQPAGEAIFTEGATLAEIKEALKAAESYTFVFSITNENESEPFSKETTYLTENAVYVKGEELNPESGEGQVSFEIYYIDYLDKHFQVNFSNGRWVAHIVQDSCKTLLNDYTESLRYLTESDDGVIVPNTEVIADDCSAYKEGSAKLSFGGTRLQIQFDDIEEGLTLTARTIYEGVNATTVEVPAEVMDAVKAAYDALP